MALSSGKLLTLHRAQGGDRVVVLGGGLAGLFAALKLAPLPVTIVSPRPLGHGASSAWAQGGIAAAIADGDTAEAHAADTLAAGAGLSDPAMTAILTREGPDRVHDLLRLGVPFDRDLEGKLRVSREAAHSARRIVRVNGDQAGAAIMASLIAAVAKTPSITVLENVSAIRIVKEGGQAAGVRIVRRGSNQATFLPARALVLATGGLGQLFKVTTNPPEAYGSGLAMALEAGAVLADAEFVQFHPTAFDIGLDPAPLATEALRGEGALLIDRDGARFMPELHPDAELAPRDVVARGVAAQIAAGRGAFLDCRSIDLRQHFPAAFAACEKAGIDPSTTPIPVAPAAHYHMGGVLTDARGRTSVAGLWACGEVACTRIHGANRLASNSLLEAVVFAARVAEDISGQSSTWYALPRAGDAPVATSEIGNRPALAAKQIGKLREAMSAHLGVTRDEAGMRAALKVASDVLEKPASETVRAMALSALAVAVAGLAREGSRGAHNRTDFPQTDAGAAHSFLTRDDIREATSRVHIPTTQTRSAKRHAAA
jgi:L-aspartate oxidase